MEYTQTNQKKSFGREKGNMLVQQREPGIKSFGSTTKQKKSCFNSDSTFQPPVIQILCTQVLRIVISLGHLQAVLPTAQLVVVL